MSEEEIILTIEDVCAEGPGYFVHKKIAAEERKREEMKNGKVNKEESTEPKAKPSCDLFGPGSY